MPPNVPLTQNMQLFVCMHSRIKAYKHAFPVRVCAHIFKHVCMRCAFAAFEVTQLCVSHSGAFGRLSERRMTAVISTTALCLSAPSSLSPSSVLHFSFPLPFHFTSTSFLYFSSILPLPHTPSSPLLISFFSPFLPFVLSVLRFIESQTMSLYCVGEWPLERADPIHF